MTGLLAFARPYSLGSLSSGDFSVRRRSASARTSAPVVPVSDSFPPTRPTNVSLGVVPVVLCRSGAELCGTPPSARVLAVPMSAGASRSPSRRAFWSLRMSSRIRVKKDMCASLWSWSSRLQTVASWALLATCLDRRFVVRHHAPGRPRRRLDRVRCWRVRSRLLAVAASARQTPPS